MELHLALRNIVKTDGPSIITEGRLVNILCDFQAFDAIPASKYVMRAIIDDGYSKKLLQCTKWDMTAQQLSGQFASSTGFQPDIVWLIFQSLAYGLGWTNTISAAANIPTPPVKNPHNRQKPTLGKNSTTGDIIQYLSSLIERKPETEKTLGVEFINVSCGAYSAYGDHFFYDCNVEVKGPVNERYLTIKVVTYSTSNSILNVVDKSISKGDLKNFGVFRICSQITGVDVSELGRILVYAE